MRLRKLFQFGLGVSPLLLLLACKILQPAPTPDAIATSVAGTKTAWARETAVRATLVAEMRTVTLTPTLLAPPNVVTLTLAPTKTLTPTPTSARSLTTPKGIGFGMNEPIERDEWTITVLSAKNRGTEITSRLGLQSRTFRATAVNQHLLLVTVDLERMNGKPIEFNHINQAPGIPRHVVVRDDAGRTYIFIASGATWGVYDPSVVRPDDTVSLLLKPKDTIDYLFTVPNNAQIIDFIWSDFPPAHLQIQ